MRPRELCVFLFAAAISSIAPPAFACFSVMSHTITLLPELPAAADQEDVIAKVEVLELVKQPWPYSADQTSFARVRVIQAIKGTEDGKVILVTTGDSFCDEMFSQRTLGTQAYIVGRMLTKASGETTFKGRRSLRPRDGERRRVP